jgi:4'-phosphopantetheinyl transferase
MIYFEADSCSQAGKRVLIILRWLGTGSKYGFMENNSMQNQWQFPANFPVLDHGQLHVWSGIYNEADQPSGRSLARDEQERSRNFWFVHDRGMFLYSHSLLRHLLAGYAGFLPEEIGFGYTKFGKPYLLQGTGPERIDFNLSHSGEVVLIGVARNLPVGVDVEKIKPLADFNQIAARNFSDSEQSDLSTLSGAARTAAFYHCWTRKEAVIKASGEGLSMPLDTFRVSLLPGEPARLIKSADDRKWMLQDLSPADGYAAAAAAPVESIEISCYSANFFPIS